MLARRVVTVAVTALVLAHFSTSPAVVPQKINYQVMLTDDADQPLADQAVALEFTIFDAAEEAPLSGQSCTRPARTR